MGDFLHRNVKRLGAGGFLASFALLAGLLLGEALVSEQAYAELGHAVALVSILGSAMCAGCLAFFVLRLHDGDPSLWTAIPTLSRGPVSGGAPDAGKDWPLLITLLFRKIAILFAGLAGWVEARA